MPATDQNQAVEIFIQTLRDLLPTLTGQDDARIIRRIGKQVTDDCAADLMGYITAGTSGNLSKNEKLALAAQIMRCLARYIKEEAGLPLTVNTCITNIGLLDYAVDSCYPGYASSKLLKYTISPLKSEEVLPLRK